MMDGILILDKEPGKTSQQAVSEVKRILGVRKAGHAGTLDPLATGVLPLFLNEATKLAQFLSQDDKEYRATMLLGVDTDTMDIEGQITGRREPEVDEARIRQALQTFTGEISQAPPGIPPSSIRESRSTTGQERGLTFPSLHGR